MASVTLTALCVVAGIAVLVAVVLGALVYRYAKLLDEDGAVQRVNPGEAGRAEGPVGYNTPRPIKQKKKKAKKGDLATPPHYEDNSRRKSQSLDTLERVIRARSVTPITSFYGNHGIDVSGYPKYADVGMGNPPATQTNPTGIYSNAGVSRRFLETDFDIIDAGIRGSVAETSTTQNSAKTAPVVDLHNISLEGLVKLGSSKAGTGTGLPDADGFGEWYAEDPELAEITTNMAGYGFDKGQPTLSPMARPRPSGCCLHIESGLQTEQARVVQRPPPGL